MALAWHMLESRTGRVEHESDFVPRDEMSGSVIYISLLMPWAAEAREAQIINFTIQKLEG
jgi:hypothetical protein